MSQKAFFSILIPSKGGENYIENVLKSVLDQEFSDYEIIIGDNNNNDEFKIVIDKFLPNPKIKIVKQTKTIDVTSSWNACLNNACGRYIIMLGDDDCILKNSLKKIYEILSSNNFPEVLTTSTQDADDPTDTTEYYGMQYTETIPVLLKAIQELNAKVETLQNEVNTLKSS